MDFDDEEAFRAQLLPRLREPIALWDATFEMPWRVFRSRLRGIARGNLERIEGAQIATWDEIPEGALVLPCDDDDWFRPDVAAVVEEAMQPGMTGLRWRSSFLEVPRDFRHLLGTYRRQVKGYRRQFLCTTNNHALFASEASKPLMIDHMQASEWVATQPPDDVPFLRERMSLQNRRRRSCRSTRRSAGATCCASSAATGASTRGRCRPISPGRSPTPIRSAR
jgi:hypothetical protein